VDDVASTVARHAIVMGCHVTQYMTIRNAVNDVASNVRRARTLGHTLSLGECGALVRSLSRTRLPLHCAHGAAVHVHLRF